MLILGSGLLLPLPSSVLPPSSGLLRPLPGSVLLPGSGLLSGPGHLPMELVGLQQLPISWPGHFPLGLDGLHSNPDLLCFFCLVLSGWREWYLRAWYL